MGFSKRTKNTIVDVATFNKKFKKLPNPTKRDLEDPLFNSIWNVIKKWDINVPDSYSGYCGANGSHVMLILKALKKDIPCIAWDCCVDGMLKDMKDIKKQIKGVI